MKSEIKILSPLRLASTPNRTIASHFIPTNDVQPDLLYMDSVLVSTGFNDNDDVFLSDEMWKARHSPILKPVDWEHNTGKEKTDSASSRSLIEDNQIIGVMYNTYAANKNGSLIDENIVASADFIVPKEFDIINQAVIYKYLYPKVSARIVGEASAGNLFVSMEAWFSDYDYQVADKIVARNEETAFLDSHLRAKGGNGHFGESKVGRVLRNIVFGGVGIVSNPANKDSIIHSFTNAGLEYVEISNSAIASNIIGELMDATPSEESQEVISIMSEKNQESAKPAVSSEDFKVLIERVVKAEQSIEQKDVEVASAKEKLEKLQKEVGDLAVTFDKGAEALASLLGDDVKDKLAKAEVSDYFATISSIVKDKLDTLADVKSKLDEATAKVAELEVEKRSVSRSAKIYEMLLAFVKDEDALASRRDKMVAATKNLDDADFEAHLEDTKELLSLAAKPAFLKKDGDDEEGKKKGKDEDDAKASDEGITDASILDDVKSEPQASAGNVTASKNDSDVYSSLAASLLSLTKSEK